MTTLFMIIRKSDKNTEAGVVPSDLLAAARPSNDGGLNAAGADIAVGLAPSSKSTRVKFSGGKPAVIDDGPFTEAKGLVAGFAVIKAESKEEAVEHAKRWPAPDGDEEVELEVREGRCPGGVAGVRPSSTPGSASPDNAGSKGGELHRYALMLKATEHTEAGFIPDDTVLAAMTRRNEEGVRTGVLIAGEGLKPSSRGARVKRSMGKAIVMDGPFTEAKELIAGFWLIQVKSREEAIEWVKRYPYPIGPDGEGEVEIREVVEVLGSG